MNKMINSCKIRRMLQQYLKYLPTFLGKVMTLTLFAPPSTRNDVTLLSTRDVFDKCYMISLYFQTPGFFLKGIIIYFNQFYLEQLAVWQNQIKIIVPTYHSTFKPKMADKLSLYGKLAFRINHLRNTVFMIKDATVS